MSHNFFSINLPYGLQKNDKNEWVAFNRKYKQLGFDFDGEDLSEDNSKIYNKYENIDEKILRELADNDKERIKINDKNQIFRITIYSDYTNPSVTHKVEHWKKYFEKIRKLSSLKKI